MVRLTPVQSELLDLIRHVGELSLYGPREFRTAKSLERKGLIRIDTNDKARLTETALKSTAAQEGGSK